MVMRVEQVDKTKNLIIYRKVRDLKGTHPTDSSGTTSAAAASIRASGNTRWSGPRSARRPSSSTTAAPARRASAPTGIRPIAGGEWWNLSHGEPFLLRSFAGNVEKLAAAVTDIVAGKEVVVPCMVDGNKDDLHLRRARIQRLKASLKLDYNPKRDFVGWGGEDFRRLQGMPGFTPLFRPGARRSRGPGDFQRRHRRRRQARSVPGRRGPGRPAAKRRRIAERDQLCPARPAAGPPSGPTTTATANPTCCWPRRPARSCTPTSAAPSATTAICCRTNRLQPDRRRLDRLRRRRPARHPARQRLPRPAAVSQQRADRYRAAPLLWAMVLHRAVPEQQRPGLQYRLSAREGNQSQGVSMAARTAKQAVWKRRQVHRRRDQ